MSQNGYGICLCLFSDFHAGGQCATRESGKARQLNCTASRSGKMTTDQSRTNETMVPTHTTPLRMGHPQPGAPRHPDWCCAAKQRGTSGRRRRNVAHDACRRASRKPSRGSTPLPCGNGRGQAPAVGRVGCRISQDQGEGPLLGGRDAPTVARGTGWSGPGHDIAGIGIVPM